MSYSQEIESIFEEFRHRSAMLARELDEIEQHTDQVASELEAQAQAEMQQFWEEHAEEIEKARAEAEEKERREVELREQQDAIARAAAHRRANQNVRPVDDEDEDDEYYRRKSWLV